MSAARSSSMRSARRKANANPYSRPPPPKPESWLTRLSKIVPSFLKSTPPPDSSSEPSSEDDAEEDPIEVAVPSINLVSRGHEIEASMNKLPQIPPPPFIQQSPPSTKSRTEAPATPQRSAQPSRHTLASLPPPASPSDSLNAIEHYLREQQRQAKEVEVQGLLSYIAQTPKEKPFRFETPLRSSPHASSSGHGQTSSLPSLPTTGRKTLPKNPNGTSFWRGGGSAKRSRNRFHSPAFGPPRSSPDRLKLSVSNDGPSDPRADSKRRRVGEDSTTSVATPSGAPVHASTPPPQPRASAPGPSPTRAAQAVPFPVSLPLSPSPTTANGSSNLPPTTPSRLRIPQKPTAPAIPSPLRQTWGQSANDSSPESSPQPQRQTKAANFMAELIKDVTPPKKPDLSNPYQTASPVKTPAGPTRPRPKRPRATGKPPTPTGKDAKEAKEDEKMSVDPPQEKVKEKPLEEYSPQAIIEATLPKGSKRSRPTFDSSTSPAPEINVVEEDTNDRRSPKRSKGNEPEPSKSTDLFGSNKGFSAFAPSTSSPSKPQAAAAFAPAPSVEMPSSPTKDATKPSISATPPSPIATAPSSSNSSSPSAPAPLSPTLNKSVFGAPKTSSIPKEPSKLRFSYQPEPTTTPPAESSVPGLPPTPKLAPAQISGLPATTNGIPRAPTLPDIPAPAPRRTKDSEAIARAKAKALAIPEDELQKFEFIIPPPNYSMDPEDVRAREIALAFPVETHPMYHYPWKWPDPEEEEEEMPAEAPKPAAPAPAAHAAPAAAPPVAFNWGAVGMKAPAAASGASWTCGTCMLSNPATATDKCTVCDSPR